MKYPPKWLRWKCKLLSAKENVQRLEFWPIAGIVTLKDCFQHLLRLNICILYDLDLTVRNIQQKCVHIFLPGDKYHIAHGTKIES